MTRRSLRWPLTVLLVLSAGCAIPAPANAPRPTPKPKAAGAATDSERPNRPLPPATTEISRKIPQGAGTVVELTGKTKLISDHGAGIVSNNTGGLIANNGGGLIANNGGGIIANNGGALVAKTKYGLRQAGPGAEAFLAEAFVEVLDGEGRVLVNERGEPLGAFTDDAGNYAFKGVLPGENLVLRVRLFPNGGARAAGGQLLAILPRGATGAVDLDTASSLGAAYVLERFVQKRPGVFDKLPAREAEALRREATAAIAQLPPGSPTYAVADQVAAADALRAKAKGLDDAFERISAILVAGQSIRAGRPAREVALAGPMGIVGDAQGNIYINEYTGGRIRVMRPDGTIALFAGGVSTTAGVDGDEALKIGFETPHALALGPDGHLYVADALRNHVRRLEIGQDGVTRVRLVAGDGNRKQGPVNVPGPTTSLWQPMALAFGPDGRLYIGEQTKSAVPGRILAVDPDGTLQEVAGPPPELFQHGQVAGLAFGPDGALYLADANNDSVYRRAPDGQWSVFVHENGLNDFSKVLVGPDGAVYVTLVDTHRVLRFTPDGKREELAGTGVLGYTGDGGPAAAAQINMPTSMWLSPGNELFFSDYGNTVVRAIDLADPARPIRTVAGTQSLSRQGDALSVPISNPAGLAIDPQGRLVVGETTSHTLRRLEGDRLTVIAGIGLGFAGDGGPASAARFDTPAGLAYRGDDLFVIDASNNRIRKIAADGTISTVVGNGDNPPANQRVFPATGPAVAGGFTLATGPDGLLYWTDNAIHTISRLRADGMVEIVAGSLAVKNGDAGDGGPAAEALLATPTSMAFAPNGDLYFVDSGNLKIRKITGLDGAAPRIETVAGLGAFATLAALGNLGATPPVEEPLDGVPLLGPISLAVTPEGDLLVGELGASKLQTLAGYAGFSGIALPPIGSRIRKITGLGGPAPRIRTVAGHGGPTLNDPASDDSLNSPFGLLIDREGRLVIADSNNNQIKLLPKGGY